MWVDSAIRRSSEFWDGRPLCWAGSGASSVERLERQFGTTFPEQLRLYIRDFGPKRLPTFEGVGKPLEVRGLRGDLRLRQAIIDAHLPGVEVVWKLSVRPRK
jgi:hypothetical protein